VEPSVVAPPLAIRCDGAILLSIEELGGLDLTGYVVWTAVVLPADEADFARERTSNAALETASKLVGRLLKKGGAGNS